ncbi:hypothetical protein HY640_01115 [Candidatus Woesearchaeota archaeon]|nr:hypothetical protein [Candidatus Woesearchaeota archaeon]
MNIKELLKKKLTKKELQLARRRFDTIGSIAVLEIPKELEKKKKIIAKQILTHKNIKTVLKKKGGHTGEFRLQKLAYIAGQKTKETVHRENGVSLKLNLGKTYFSPRLGTERLRIARQINHGEEVLVMFSGCAPYPLVISKNSQAKRITAVELNPDAHRYALENISLNKAGNIEPVNSDIRAFSEKTRKKFDRIIMPLPKGASEFLPQALKLAHKNTIIHYYDFLEENSIPGEAIAKINMACMKARKKPAILGWRKCGQLAARKFRLCIDFQII